LHLTEIQQVLSVVDMEAELLEYFDLKMTLPAFRVEGITFCGKDLVLEMERILLSGGSVPVHCYCITLEKYDGFSEGERNTALDVQNDVHIREDAPVIGIEHKLLYTNRRYRAGA
jgi:hypothetical protein